MPALLALRGPAWQELVSQVIASGPESTEQIAFTLMMARLNNCATCNADSHRSISGCSACSMQALRRTHHTDQALVEIYEAARGEVETYFQRKNHKAR